MTRTRASIGLIAIGAVLIAAVGCGSSSPGRASGPFAWLHPGSAPSGWSIARTPAGASFAYPPGWTPIKTDPGTASVALGGAGAGLDGYLNATPKQGTETLANWSRFRPRHNLDEGARDVRLVASITNVPFRSGRASCVIDGYTTSKAPYREIACLASGQRSTAVVVAAAPGVLWSRRAATLQRAVSSFVP